MIKSLFRLVVLVLLAAGWGLAALSLHVIRTPDKIGLIPKNRLDWRDTYVDARAWTLADLSNHPSLVKRVIESDRARLFKYLADPNNPDVAGQIAAKIKDDPSLDAIRPRLPGREFFTPPALTTPPAKQSSAAGVDGITIPLEF